MGKIGNGCARGAIHETTRALVNNHSSKFCIEDLNIQGMSSNGGTHKKPLNGILSNKSEEAGGWVRKVNPRNTSQVCSECGAKPPTKRTLGIRLFVCLSCGYEGDRDVNAARNVPSWGLASWSAGTIAGMPGAGRTVGALAPSTA